MKRLIYKRNFSSTPNRLKPDLIVVPTATAATLANVIAPLFAVLIGSASYYFGVFRYGDPLNASIHDFGFVSEYLEFTNILNTWVLSNVETLTRDEMLNLINQYQALVNAHLQGIDEMKAVLDECDLSFVERLVDPQVRQFMVMYHNWISATRGMTDVYSRLIDISLTNL